MQLIFQPNPESLKEGRGSFSKHFLLKNSFILNFFSPNNVFAFAWRNYHKF